MPQLMREQCVAGAMLMFLVGTFAPAARAEDYTVATAIVNVRGTPERVLTDAQGMTLYYLATDSSTHSTCTGGCAQVWQPLLSGGAPTSSGALPGRLALVKTANGLQVSYNGHLLYRYSGDAAPGQTNGNAAERHWWVVGIDVRPEVSTGPNTVGPTVEHKEGGNSAGGGGNGGGMEGGGGGMGGR
jgi:predicted lipoprotein with Yx(FWY)xxD motif